MLVWHGLKAAASVIPAPFVLGGRTVWTTGLKRAHDDSPLVARRLSMPIRTPIGTGSTGLRSIGFGCFAGKSGSSGFGLTRAGANISLERNMILLGVEGLGSGKQALATYPAFAVLDRHGNDVSIAIESDGHLRIADFCGVIDDAFVNHDEAI